ncbi:hypothetical protein HMPREF3152_07010 [Actinomyces sp. HMSC06A08]|uniref:Uncharacterized protein n=1 Tax=Winkia neuii TaxID=33007 RepID=A0A2I1INB5_9ACTO|nr:hypothetical protein HMPREF3198_00372 [Winkia neuii]OFJ69559.1 hypothetical protein HMPREF2851_01245 [Actinomyces sp. HMSC064C12]OFK01532.1 hypothetical protein HMPREF2835_02350 [Actinomyces sp. HMSC072A03]OFT55083.1 hypothetical protein HMPREF3152_07010 [Actinomyces sp. HMSC06A08]PKY72582.1 hypothetical protein CYJ19_07005 [Winkia neuii]
MIVGRQMDARRPGKLNLTPLSGGALMAACFGEVQRKAASKIGGARCSWRVVSAWIVVLAFVAVAGCAAQSIYTVHSGDVGADAWYVGLLPFDRQYGSVVLIFLTLFFTPILGALVAFVASWFLIGLGFNKASAAAGMFGSLSFGEGVGHELGIYLLLREIRTGNRQNKFYDPVKSRAVQINASSSIFSDPWVIWMAVGVAVAAIVGAYLLHRHQMSVFQLILTGMSGLFLLGFVIYRGQYLGILLVAVAILLMFLLPVEIMAVQMLIDTRYPAICGAGSATVLFAELGAIFTLTALVCS